MINEGDIVVLSRTLERDTLHAVVRVTKTQAILEIKNYAGEPHEWKFNRETGVEVGNSSGYRRWRICQATPAEIQRIQERERKEELLNKIEKARIQNANNQQLEAILRILTPPEVLAEDTQAAQAAGSEGAE